MHGKRLLNSEARKKGKRSGLELVAALKQCINDRDLQSGKRLHQQAVDAGLDSTNKYVSAALITLYSKCREAENARAVFDRIPPSHRDAFTWTNLILGYTDNGLHAAAMDLFQRMDSPPTEVTYVAVLKACAGLASSCKGDEDQRLALLAKGVEIHSQVTSRGFGSNLILTNTLVDMYSKCGRMKLAREVFDGTGTANRNAVTWTCLIMGYVENWESETALQMFERMDCKPDSVTYLAVLKACTALAGEKEKCPRILKKGKEFHRQLREHGYATSRVVGNALIEMYGKLGSVELALQVFEKLERKDVVSWTCLIQRYMENGESLQAVETFERMDCPPDSCSYIAALKSYALLASEDDSRRESCLARGVSIHEKVGESVVRQDVMLQTALLDMYAKCGSLSRAKDMFDGMKHTDVVAWTCLIQGYVENGESERALGAFHSMNCLPNAFAFASAIKACGELACIENGSKVHKLARAHHFDESDVVVGAALVDMYSKCGRMSLARQTFDRMLFRNSVAWSSLILGYVENGDFASALEVFDSMDCQPSSFTYVAALRACGGLAETDTHRALEKGRKIHQELSRQEFAPANTFVGNTLLEMYTKCGSMSEAEDVFNAMKTSRNVVAWNSLITGYVKLQQNTRALDLFQKMTTECQPDATSYSAALKACGGLGEFSPGLGIHATVCRVGVEEDRLVGATLISHHAKFGRITTSEILFDGSPDSNLRHIVPWNALMTGYSSVGDSDRVFDLAYRMREAGVRMDGVMAICILTTCSHSGKVEEGRRYFEVDMPREGITPNLDHYNCMVDLFGRANRLDEAMEVIRSMPMESDKITWMTLLGACKKWNNLEMAKVAFDEVGARGDCPPAAYVLVSNIYEGSN